MKTSTGHVAPIEVSSGVKCGGAVARLNEMLPDANTLSMKAKMTKKTKRTKML